MQHNQSLSASLSPAGAISRTINSQLIAPLTFLGSIVRKAAILPAPAKSLSITLPISTTLTVNAQITTTVFVTLQRPV